MKKDAVPGLGIFSWFSYQLPLDQRLKMVKDAGFDGVALWWGDEFGDKNSQPEMTRKLGLEIDYVHAPFDDPNDLWRDGLNGEDYVRRILSDIHDCSRHNIKTIVMHITRLSSRPEVTRLGLDRVKRLTELAEKEGICLALENLDSIRHLDYIYSEISSSCLGFCYDSGHENCNHPNAGCLDRYGGRLFAVHLADNWGDDDTHLLPYDGSISWDMVGEKLRGCRPLRYLTLEADFNRGHPKSRIYEGLSAQEFLALAYKRAVRFREGCFPGRLA